MRTVNKNILNLVISISTQIILLILGLIVPRLILSSYGSDSNGVLNTVAQIFAYMALLEAGIGKSTRNALYTPLKTKNKEDVSCILSSSKRYYTKTSVIYLSIVLVITVILPFLIKSNLDKLTIALIVFFEGMTNVVSFYFISCWESLLIVDGKSYITSSIGLISKILCYIVKILLSIFGINIIFIQVGYFVISLIKVLLYKIYLSRRYNWINWHFKECQFKFNDNKSYLIAEISWTVFNSTDMIVLSCFLSSKLSSVYSVYNMVYIALMSLMSVAFNSVLYLLGNANSESKEKFAKMYDLFNSIFIGLITILMCVTYWLIIPFIKIYTKGINDINYIYPLLPVLFCLVQMISWSRTTSESAIGMTGNIKKIVPFYLIETISNIVLSCIFVNFLGITGVLLATVVTMPVKMIVCNVFMDKYVLKRSIFSTAKIVVANFIVFILTVIIYNSVDFNISTIGKFIIFGFVFVIIYFIVIFIVNMLVNKNLKLIFKKH